MAGKLIPASSVIAAVEKHMSKRWDWGASDCCKSAEAAFAELHGIHLMSHVEPYDTAVKAARMIKCAGGVDALVADAAERNGLREGIGVSGEIGYSHYGAAEGAGRRAVLICIEPGSWAGKTECGYAILPNAERSWRV